MSPTYTSELYKPFTHSHNTRRSNCRLQSPYRNTSYGHKVLSFSSPKSSSNINRLKHNIKKLFFQRTSEERRQYLFLLLRTYFTKPVPTFQSSLFQVTVGCNHFSHLYVCALVSVCISFTKDHNENKVFAICIVPYLPPSF